MNRCFICLVVALAPFALRVAAETIFVSPSGQAGVAGSAAAPLASLAEAAVRAKPGDVIRVAGGSYKHDQTIVLQASGTADAPIRIEPADTASWPLLDFSAQKFGQNNHGIAVHGDYWQIVGLEVFGAGRFGISVTGHHNIIEHCRAHDNQGTGINLGAPASHTLVVNCDSYRNVDRPTKGQNADGFGAKFQVGPGNIFRGCRAWENADDGFDLWRAPFPVRIENCVAARGGIDVWGIEGFTGNGNGFKVGGDFIAAPHVITDCVAIDIPKRGFDQNNNTAPLVIERCTATRCKIGFSFTLATTSGRPHVLRDCVGWDAPAVLFQGTVVERGLWTSGQGSPVPPTFVNSTPMTKGPKPPEKKTE